MLLKAGLLFLTFLAVSCGLPVKERDTSIFPHHADSPARIVGGEVAGPVPYMVGTSSGLMVRQFICGASLVTTRHILTAAHCIVPVIMWDTDILASSLRAHIGSNSFMSGTMYTLSTFILHPDFDYPSIKNDIGFLITTHNVALTSTVSLAPLTFDYTNGGVPTNAYGWGVTGTAPSPEVLMQLDGTVIGGSECAEWVTRRSHELHIQGAAVNPEIEICAFNSNGRGMCNHDSGSPLMRADRNQQIGVLSWGILCARNAPDVFVRISAFRSFIEQSLRHT